MTAWRAKAWAHVEMMRPYTLSYSGLLALAGASTAADSRLPTGRALQSALVTMCGWLAGHYVGDYFDRDIDARSKPDRPVPSGRVSPREALACMLLLIVGGNAAALHLGPRNLAAAIVTTLLGIAYSRIFKAMALLGNLDRGVLGACAVVFGAFAVARPTQATLLVASATIAHDGATNLVGAIRDVDGDRASNCQTVPVVYGVPRAVEIASALASVSLLFALAALRRRSTRAALALFAAASAIDVLVYGRLLLQRNHVTRAQALGAHKLLVLERNLLSGAFVATRAPKLAIVLLSVVTPVSLVLQSTMRDRYERSHA